MINVFDDEHKVSYSAYELNLVASNLLAYLTEEAGVITLEEGLKVKEIFNSFIVSLVQDEADVRKFLKEAKDYSPEEALEEDVWNALDAANKIAEEATKDVNKE